MTHLSYEPTDEELFYRTADGHEAIHAVTRTKVRAIDPYILRDGKLHRLSELDPAFAERRKAHLEARSQPMALWVTRPSSRNGATGRRKHVA